MKNGSINRADKSTNRVTQTQTHNAVFVVLVAEKNIRT